MNGDGSDCYVDGVSVHDAFARMVALHAISDMTIKNSVGYNVRGHNIFLEDGIEIDNVIEGNLIVGPVSAWNML